MDLIKKFLIAVFQGAVILFLLTGCNQSTVTLESLLIEMTDREAMTRFPDPSFSLKQVSSYNPASVKKDSAGWFANFDMSHFRGVRQRDGLREFILFDVEGPGAIVRWWMTFYKASHGTIRVYIDHAADPVIEGTPDEILSGNLLTGYPFSASVQEGAPVRVEGWGYDHNFYLPVPFAEHAMITYECDSLVKRYEREGVRIPEGYWWPDVFYNIGYRHYPEGTSIRSFSLEELEKAENLIGNTGRELLNPDQQVNGEESEKFSGRLMPGDSLVMEFNQEDASIQSIALRIKAEKTEQSLRSTVLSASFDGNYTVWVPAGEFFGTGYSMAPHETWMNRVSNDGEMVSYWIMPFREDCRLAFINFGNQEIALSGEVVVGPYTWEPGSMYFGSAWHEYRHIRSRDETGSPFDLNFIQIDGKGVYVGDQVTLFNNTWHWWGEGDEKIYVDGEQFPSSFGTGSEDYYGYSFGRPDPFSHPFLAQPVGKGNTDYGVTVNSRYRSLDAIPFRSSIRADIELWHWADVIINYALTSYWYAEDIEGINIHPDITAVRHAVAMDKEDLE